MVSVQLVRPRRSSSTTGLRTTVPRPLDRDQAGAELAGQLLLGGEQVSRPVAAMDAREQGLLDPGVEGTGVRRHCRKNISF
jgi:hypothetical protein